VVLKSIAALKLIVIQGAPPKAIWIGLEGNRGEVKAYGSGIVVNGLKINTTTGMKEAINVAGNTMLKRAGIALLVSGILAIMVIMILHAQRTQFEFGANSKQDMMALSQFLAHYAIDHGGRFPDSWNQLMSASYVVIDQKSRIQFVKYGNNTVFNPGNLRCLWGASLDDYEIKDNYIVDHDNHPARIVWLEGISPNVSSELYYSRVMLDAYKHGAGKTTGGKLPVQKCVPTETATRGEQ
jgi:hypothetical protein